MQTNLYFWCVASLFHQSKDNAKKVKGLCQRISTNLPSESLQESQKTKGHNVTIP